MAQKINATEAARNFSELINRTFYRRESFLVVRNGETVCQVVPPQARVKWKDLVEILKQADRPDSDFARDLADIQAAQPPMPSNVWD